jgi:membrane protease YdiL (CAAX protease family)
MTTQQSFNWKGFFALWLAAIVGVVALIPYSFTLLKASAIKIPLPLATLILLQVVQSAAIMAVATAVGLFLAGRIGLGAPILEAAFAGENVGARIKAILVPSIASGVIASLVVITLGQFVFTPAIRAELGAANPLVSAGAQPPAWQGLLASFYGGIDEEILLRLFVLSLLAFLGKFISRTAQGRPTLAVLWIANILAAILFGLGHLPATAVLVPLTPLVVTRAIVLNGLVGLVTGYLYFSRGIESAMLAHFSGDLVLHVIAAL